MKEYFVLNLNIYKFLGILKGSFLGKKVFNILMVFLASRNYTMKQ